MTCLSSWFHTPLATGLSVQKQTIQEQSIIAALRDHEQALLLGILTQEMIGSNLSVQTGVG